MDALLALQEREAAVLAELNSELSNVYRRLNERLDEINTARHAVLNGTNNGEMGRQTGAVTHRGTILEASATALDDTSRRLGALALDTLGSSASRLDIVSRSAATCRWPNFWLHALLGCSITRQYIYRRDEKILSYLDNFKVKLHNSNERVQEFELTFYFSKNPYFTNESLSRTFYLDDVKGESYATTIDWLPLGEKDMEATNDEDEEYDEEYDDGGGEGGDYEEEEEERYRATFFDFFYNTDTDDDFSLAAALLLKVYRSPLKYVARYLTKTAGGQDSRQRPALDGTTFIQLVQIAGEASDCEDEGEECGHHGEGANDSRGYHAHGHGNSTRPGGRYPFSWVLDLWKAYNRLKND